MIAKEPGLADQQLASIAASIAHLVRQHYGRDAIAVTAYTLEDMIVVVIRGRCFTALEKALLASGEPQAVIALRTEFETMMCERYKEVIGSATGRSVVALLSASHVDPDITVQTVFLDRPLRRLTAVPPNPTALRR